MTVHAARSLPRRLVLAAIAGEVASWWRPRSAHAGTDARYSSGVRVSTLALGDVPAVPVVSMNGQALRLDRALDVDAPLLLNFVFTTCSTTCSMQTAVLADLQRQCVAERQAVRLVSVTIDPDNDTPEQLQRFSKSFQIQPGWQFLTGRFDDLLRVQRHFDVYRGSKVAHPPVVLLRKSARATWVRVEGVASAADLMLALHALPAGA
jgi:protein SCO1/2